MFAEAIDVVDPVERIVIDVSDAHFWDISAIGALDRLVLKARRHGHTVEVVGLNEASATMVERFAVHKASPWPKPARSLTPRSSRPAPRPARP